MMSRAETDIAGVLLRWYDSHARRLPWRVPPGGGRPDPYRAWLSEIMLQQTTVATVADYYAKFTARWPGVEDLAAAPLDDVLSAWAGLGYYARARNLHKCARLIAAEYGGRFPETEEGLRALPGIGRYTAAAVAAIAFDRPAAVMDGNVERVISRLYAIETPLPQAKEELYARVEALTPDNRPGDFAQAMMDLGATVCTPGRPKCMLCPLSGFCTGQAIAERLPVKAPKKAKPTRRGTAYWIERPDGAVLLRRRPETGLLGGMTEFPSTDWTEHGEAGPDSADLPLALEGTAEAGEIRHTFTHFHLVLKVIRAQAQDAPVPPHCRWCMPDRLGEAALPTVMRKVAKTALTATVGENA
jgi:A/G-specific adenine glycosylase